MKTRRRKGMSEDVSINRCDLLLMLLLMSNPRSVPCVVTALVLKLAGLPLTPMLLFTCRFFDDPMLLGKSSHNPCAQQMGSLASECCPCFMIWAHRTSALPD